ncbi:non-specific serine/threonine protein kinase [Anaerobacterium chartisolvens]|uniref:Non-specific serine/threonine protein kinase n=1 Tax=Anaerobacterium chartisolvens TaxID=1297424 RepID=A0A369BA29_9FIRM|nr:DEAD/DEAH box helicase [Anaerobacterium chartisolvens]RCX18383.1 non-specific serine/threonine protein kinase [Anaerobacterium chartisolvens]
MEYTTPKPRELIAIIEPDGGYALDWQYVNKDVEEYCAKFQQNIYDMYLADRDMALLMLGAAKKNVVLPETVEYLFKVASAFVKCLSRNPDLEALREKAKGLPEDKEQDELLAEAPFINGAEYLDRHWITCAWDKLNKIFSKEMKKHQGTVAEYFISKNPDIHFAGKVYFHLVESKKEDYPFALLATYAAEPSAVGKARHLPLKNALMEYGQNSKKLLELLSTVNKAAGQSQFISGLVETGEIFYPIGLYPDEAYTFLKEVPLYESAGVLCRIPNWWRKKAESLKMSVSIGEKAASFVGLDALVDFNVHLSLGGEKITVEELNKLVSESEGLAFIKGKWVEVDPIKLRETLAAYEHAKREAERGELTMMEAMRMQLSAEKLLNIKDNICEVEVSNGEWLETILAQLKSPDNIKAVGCGANFNATLREYQQKGLGWLYTMKELGLGACLADDMGLGKTIQVIALLNSIRMKKEERVLLVVPASLISNWTSEIARFAPMLKHYVIHPQESRIVTEADDSSGGVYITTYGMLLRLEWIKQTEWDIIVLDEAQAIKNAGTKQSKTVKQLKARSRIALTGTPVENRLSDLWSIFDFLNKGLLGSAKEFTEFSKKLKENSEGYAKLKQMISPFIMRRLKTDKSIIADLPEKIEMKTYSTLSKRQAALYSSMVDELQRKLETTEGIERKGLVLAALTKFKQICNHPDQYLGQHTYAENESGKYQRLREICETIYEKRERVIVFTQFKEITEPIAAFLKDVFQHEGLVLHGETPVAKRKDIVARFQGHEYVPFMVLSIKAGGVGLNLTAANHVIHFDRWWNPAVENQATDRAFRIGQRKNVLVHKFITKGTVEEKIDRMIEEKIKITSEIMPDMNERWITEMDSRQLMDLFRLTV